MLKARHVLSKHIESRQNAKLQIEEHWPAAVHTNGNGSNVLKAHAGDEQTAKTEQEPGQGALPHQSGARARLHGLPDLPMAGSRVA